MSEIQNYQPQNVSAFSSELAFKEAQRMGALLAGATMGVPREYQNNLPNCVVALEYAGRLGVSPIMVMQNIDIIHNKPAPKSTFIIALINASGKFSEDLEFVYTGAEGTDARTCFAKTKRKDGRVVEGSKVSVAMAKNQGWYNKPGSKWPDMTDQMLAYRAAAFFSRIHCPNVTMGMQSADEIEDVGYVETAVADKTIINDINTRVAGDNPEEGTNSPYVDFEEIPEDANNLEVHQEEHVASPPPPPGPPPAPVEDDDF